MDPNRSITDRFPHDRVDSASIPVPFGSFVDCERRVRELDRDKSDGIIVKSIGFHPVEERNRYVSVLSPTKSAHLSPRFQPRRNGSRGA